MEREKFKKLAQDFMSTFGYKSKTIPNFTNVLLFSRPTGTGTNEEKLAYFHEVGEEAYLETRLSDLNKRYERIPESSRFFLSPAPLGAVPKAVSENKFIYQIPIWFFDRNFSEEKQSTPLKRFEESALTYKFERIGQPYKIDQNRYCDDLLKQLEEELIAPEQSWLRIIVAPAGYGKTVLMATLYKNLKDRFMEGKKKQEFFISPRPIIMLPQHLGMANDLEDFINNFIIAEYDYGVINQETLKFLIKNNFAIWLLDGVEELILKDPECIYKIIDDFVSAPDAENPQIVLAIRKTIFESSSELRQAIYEWKGIAIKVYELDKWNIEEKKSYFMKNLKKETSEVEAFLKEISQSPVLNSLCDVPYYCSLISDLINNDRMSIFNDEVDLVEYAFKEFCEREYTKGLDREVFPMEIQKELFIELAKESFIGGNVYNALVELSDIFLENLEKNKKEAQFSCLKRHALLTQTGDDMDFHHDIMKQYLISINLLEHLKRCNLKLFDIVEIEADSFIMRYLIKHLSYLANWDSIITNLSQFPSSPKDNAIGFRNILKILLCSNIDRTPALIKNYLKFKNLKGLAFKNLDMNNFQFQGSKLDCTVFENCNLSNANFNGCLFKNTSIDDACNLSGVTTKDAIFESIIVDNKLIDNPKRIAEFFYRKTKVSPERLIPCPAAINLKKVLERLARKGKGTKIPKKFIIRISRPEYVEEAIKGGILTEEEDYIKIKFQYYEDVKDFVENLRATEIMLNLLNNICSDVKLGCKHVYKV